MFQATDTPVRIEHIDRDARVAAHGPKILADVDGLDGLQRQTTIFVEVHFLVAGTLIVDDKQSQSAFVEQILLARRTELRIEIGIHVPHQFVDVVPHKAVPVLDVVHLRGP